LLTGPACAPTCHDITDPSGRYHSAPVFKEQARLRSTLL